MRSINIPLGKSDTPHTHTNTLKMPRSPRRQTVFAANGRTNVSLNELPIAVAKNVIQAQREEMRARHEKQRKAISEELKRVEARMKSDAFAADIRKRLSKIRTTLNKSPKKRKKSVRFAHGVKRSSKHRVMK